MRKILNLQKHKYWAPQSLIRFISIGSAALDARAPLMAKVIAFGTIIYALSPIDLIPDFIPVIGWIDDAVIVTLGLWLTAKVMPPGLLQEHYERRSKLRLF